MRVKIKMGVKREQSNVIVVGFVVLFALLFSGVSVYNVNLANEKVRMMREHPITVSTSIYKLRSILQENGMLFEEAISSHGAETDAVSKKLAVLDQESAEILLLLQKKYTGPQEDIAEIDESIRTFREKRDIIIRSLSTAERRAIETELMPFYNRVDAALDTVITFSGKKSKALWQESIDINLQNIYLMCFLSAMTILLAVAFYRTVLRKVDEIAYRDYLFRILAENVENVFLIYRCKTGLMEYISPNVERIFGIERRELERKMQVFSYCEDMDAKIEAAFAKEDVSERLEAECWLQNPRTRQKEWINFGIFPVYNENESITRYVLCLTSLTERRKSQQALQDALLSAQNANQAKSNFLSRVSHEIRTPMNAIIGMTTIAASSIDNKVRVGDCLTKISLASKHLLLLINDVLDMSKIENGKLKLTHASFNLSDVVAEINSIIYPQIKARNQEFKISMSGVEHESLVGDALRLNQVLLNILSNAVKFTPSGGQIELKVQEMPHRHHPTARFRFTVSDTGIGIKKEFLTKLFKPFEQDRAGMRMHGGTGLGMAITKNIVSMMGGTIRVESEEGHGSTFIVEVNFVPEEREEQKCFDDLKALLVDDEQECCEHAMVLLQRLGVTAEWVLSGREAVEKTVAAYRDNDSYDVLFLDWKMPDLDGVETAREIRKNIGPDTLIIILTAYDWSDIEEEARAAGIDGFIAKPLFQSTLYHTLLGIGTPNHSLHAKDQAGKEIFADKRILIAEDNEINIEIVLEMLGGTGAVIHAAWNGAEAVAMFENSPEGYYDIILMDIQMPVLDGYEATRKIRALPRRDSERVVIVAMTANAFNEDVMASYAAGMNAHVAKPLEAGYLIQRIAQALADEKEKAADLTQP